MILQKIRKFPNDEWHFIEKYLPHYFSRDDVLLSDILQRYIDGEDVLQEDIQMIKKDISTNQEEVQMVLKELNDKLKEEAWENYQLLQFKTKQQP